MTFPFRAEGPMFKPEPQDAEANKRAAKERDGRCRRPDCPFCFRAPGIVLDGCHVFQVAGNGGDPLGIRSERRHFVSLCRQSHQLQEPHKLICVPESEELLGDGPVRFYRVIDGVQIFEGVTTP